MLNLRIGNPVAAVGAQVTCSLQSGNDATGYRVTAGRLS
jgi:hypothetical protein